MSHRRLKILHITNEYPFFPGGMGGQTRQYNLLKNLSDRHEFHYAGPCGKDESLDILQELFCKIMFPQPNFFLRQISSIEKRRDRGYPAIVRQQERMRVYLTPIIRKALNREQYDIINIEHTDIAHWLCPISTHAKKIIVAHNVKTIMWNRYHEQAKQAEKDTFYNECKRFENYERQYLRNYDGIIAMSEVDKGYIEGLTGKEVPVFVVPNGVDTDFFKPQAIDVDPKGIVFTGTMNHPPNNEGMLYFCRDIFPRVLAREPNAKLSIVGNAPSKDVLSLADGERIQVTGFVPDTRPYMASASVVIVPLLSGSGTRLKILEAMSMGKAIVSTSLGAEGINCTNGEDIILADTPGDFADKVLELMGNPDRARALGNKARQRASDEYSWKNLSYKLEDIYTSYAIKAA